MALTTTLLLMRTAVRRAANVTAFTDVHDDTSVNALINRGLGALSRICRSINPEFQPIASTTITTDGDNTSFALPAGFRSLISVEYTADEHKVWLEPYEMHERAALTDSTTASNSTRAECYRVIGSNLELLPLPPEDHTALVWYATTVTQLANDASTFDTVERLDDYVIWYAAREIALERDDWERHDRLDAKMRAMVPEIQILARSIDLSAASRVVDQEAASQAVRYR